MRTAHRVASSLSAIALVGFGVCSISAAESTCNRLTLEFCCHAIGLPTVVECPWGCLNDIEVDEIRTWTVRVTSNGWNTNTILAQGIFEKSCEWHQVTCTLECCGCLYDVNLSESECLSLRTPPTGPDC